MQSFAPDFPMPAGYVWQYEWIRWLQQDMHPWMAHLAYRISWLGSEQCLLLVVCVLLWSVHRPLGMRAAYVLLCSMWVNDALKTWFRVTRPVGIPGIRTPSEALPISGYAMPSGHAQGTATMAALLARWSRRRTVAAVGLVITAAVGVSRVYLGLHWPLDVLVGWALGLAFGWIGWGLGRWWTYREIRLPVRTLLAVALPAAMVLVKHDPISLDLAGMALGLGAGWLADERWLGLAMGSAWWKRLCAAVIGTGGLIALQLGMNRWPLPEWSSLLHGLVIGLWAVLGAPVVFWLCGLYERRRAM